MTTGSNKNFKKNKWCNPTKFKNTFFGNRKNTVDDKYMKEIYGN